MTTLVRLLGLSLIGLATLVSIGWGMTPLVLLFPIGATILWLSRARTPKSVPADGVRPRPPAPMGSQRDERGLWRDRYQSTPYESTNNSTFTPNDATAIWLAAQSDTYTSDNSCTSDTGTSNNDSSSCSDGGGGGGE